MVAAIGTYLLVSTHAASPYASNEVENGTLAGGANKVTDGTASGGSYVRFGSASSSGYTGTCTKTITAATNVGSALSGMSAGQVLCLNSGTYGTISSKNTFATSGSAGSPIIITSGPGQTATLNGAEEITGSNLTFEYLNIDDSNTYYVGNGGSNPAPCHAPVSDSMNLSGSNITLQYNNIYQSQVSLRAVLIFIYSPGAVTIRYNKISDAGSCNQTQHLIYDDMSNGAQIYGNWMWNDAYGYAVQLYPAPSNTKVYSNVIDSTLDGTVDATSGSGNQTYNNVIENSVVMPGFTSGQMVDCLGSGGDTVNNNASWNNVRGFGLPCSGVTATGNITLAADPFVSSSAHNYVLNANAPDSVKAYGLWDGVGPPSPDPAP